MSREGLSRARDDRQVCGSSMSATLRPSGPASRQARNEALSQIQHVAVRECLKCTVNMTHRAGPAERAPPAAPSAISSAPRFCP